MTLDHLIVLIFMELRKLKTSLNMSPNILRKMKKRKIVLNQVNQNSTIPPAEYGDVIENYQILQAINVRLTQKQLTRLIELLNLEPAEPTNQLILQYLRLNGMI